MMKLWTLLYLLVLAISSVSGGETSTVTPEIEDHSDREESLHRLTQTQFIQNETTGTTTPALSPNNGNATDQTVTAIMAEDQNFKIDNSNTTEGANFSTNAPPLPGTPGKEGDDSYVTTLVSMATASTTSKPATREDSSNHYGAYVILVIIILVIIVLCSILYFLRRASRTYSFDLQRPPPPNNLRETTGTFEPVYLDDLDLSTAHDKETVDDGSPPGVANGTTPQSEERASTGENAASDEQPDTTSLSVGDAPEDETSTQLNSTNLLLDAVGDEQQNGNNNNNPSGSSSYPFVEINLNDPMWSEPVFTSPEPSSVLPFSFPSSPS